MSVSFPPPLPSAALATPPRDATVVLVPLLLLLLGLGLRYAAYLSVNALGSPSGFVSAMCVWDCYWYGDVALHGYQAYPETLNFGGPAGIANWAFFPLYPLLIAMIGNLVPLAPATLGTIVSPLLTLAAVLFAWPLFRGDRRAYYLFGALLLAGPFSFYFTILYSESLFLLLTVLAFLQLERRHYLGAGLFGALLAATRTVGVLFVFSIALAACGELRRGGRKALIGRPEIVLAIFLAPLGLFLFMAWLYLATGDALAFVHIQRGWDRQLMNPLAALWDGLVASGDLLQAPKALALAAILGLALCAGLAGARRHAEALFCALSIGLALCNGLESMVRFVAALAPLNLLLAQILARSAVLFWLALALSALLDYLLTTGWLHQHGALM